jgi:hypothetical protein
MHQYEIEHYAKRILEKHLTPVLKAQADVNDRLLEDLARLEKRVKELEGPLPNTVVLHHLRHEIETSFPQDPRDSDKCRLCGCSWISWDMMIVCLKAREEEQ